MTATEADRFWLQTTVDLSRLSPPSPAHYAVGAAIVDAGGTLLATGYTGEGDPHFHAEEAALAKLTGRLGPDGAALDLTGATVYSSLEPCTVRKSRPYPCTGLILAAGLRRVVFALREPLFFADCTGVEALSSAGAEVLEVAEFGPAVAEINAHILKPARALR